MPRVKVPKSIIANRAKWEANRQKPSKLNPSRRRKDLKTLIKGLVESPTTLISEERERRTLSLDLKKRVAIKKMRHYSDTRNFYRFLQNQKFETIQLIPIKSFVAKDAKMRNHFVQKYFKRPSLVALRDFLRGSDKGPENAWIPDAPLKHSFLDFISGIGEAREDNLTRPIGEIDRHYCESLMKANPRINLKMVAAAIKELKDVFWDWPMVQHADSAGETKYTFKSGTNLIVLGISKNSQKLKIGLVDV